jgi:hypothetical protein
MLDLEPEMDDFEPEMDDFEQEMCRLGPTSRPLRPSRALIGQKEMLDLEP